MKTKLIFTAAGFALAVSLVLAWNHGGSSVEPLQPLRPLVLPLQVRSEVRNDAPAPTLVCPSSIVAEPTRVAGLDTPAAVRELLDRITTTRDWSSRAALAKELRFVSEPSTLQVLLPALLETYGRGNTIFNEISDAVARMADTATVETLEVMHWEASAHAGQGRKILRTVAAIRNPPAKRALAKLAARAASPALAACAEEALKAMGAQAGL